MRRDHDQLAGHGRVCDAGRIQDHVRAQWGASRVACYGPDGSFRHAVSFAASQISCPAFGGAELQTLFATSATEGLRDASGSADGQTFALRLEVTGQSEHQIRL